MPSHPCTCPLLRIYMLLHATEMCIKILQQMFKMFQITDYIQILRTRKEDSTALTISWVYLKQMVFQRVI